MAAPSPKIIPIKLKKTKKKGTIFSPNPEDESSEEGHYIIKKSYCDHNILYGPTSSGSLFERWNEDRKKVSDLATEENISDIFKTIFPKDTLCKSHLGTDGRHYMISQSCSGCQFISRLFKRGEEGRNKHLVVQAGEMAGKELFISHISYSIASLDPYIEQSFSREYGIRSLKSLHHMQICEHGYSTRINRTKTYGTTSPISNYIAISCILEQEMKNLDLPSLPMFRWMYECSDGIVMVEEKIGNKGNLDILSKHSDYTKSPTPTSTVSKIRPLRIDVCRLLLMQLAINLSFMNNYDFTHGAPCLNKIIITKEPSMIKYDSIKLESPFTLHIIPSEYSSITISTREELIRLFYKSKSDINLTQLSDVLKINFQVSLGSTYSPKVCLPFNENVTDNMCEKYKSMRILSYKIGSTNSFDIYTREMGIALFPSSFDTYAFLVSLMVEESFYQALINDDDLNKIWTSIWLPDDFPSVMKELAILRKFSSEKHTCPDYSMIREMLGKFYLRCDGLHFLWQSLKNLTFNEED